MTFDQKKILQLNGLTEQFGSFCLDVINLDVLNNILLNEEREIYRRLIRMHTKKESIYSIVTRLSNLKEASAHASHAHPSSFPYLFPSF